MRLEDWYFTQPKVIGTDSMGNPIEGDSDSRVQMRGRFMTRSAATALLTKIQEDIGGPELPLVEDTKWLTPNDPKGRKFYLTTIKGQEFELGQLFAMASQAVGVGAAGRWVEIGAGVTFIADQVKPVVNERPLVETQKPVFVGDAGEFTAADRAMLIRIAGKLGAL